MPAADITDWTALTPDDFFAALKTACRAESVPAVAVPETERRLAGGVLQARELHQVLLTSGQNDNWASVRQAALVALTERPDMAVTVVHLESQRLGSPAAFEETADRAGFTARAALTGTQRGFLQASERAAVRSSRRRRGAFAVLAVLTVLAVAAAGFAFSQRTAAIRQRDQAIYNQVIAEALQFGASDTPLAAQLTLAAYRIRPTQDLASRLLNTENTPLSSPLATGGGGVISVAFSPGGRTLAGGSADGTVRVWDVTDPAHPRPLGQPPTGGTGPVGSVAFSPGGRTLAGGSVDGTIRVWDVTDSAHPRPLGQPLTGGTGPVGSVAFSPDGHTLVGGNYDGTIRLWTLNVQYAIQRICATAGGLTPRQWNQYIPQLRYQPSCVH